MRTDSKSEDEAGTEQINVAASAAVAATSAHAKAHGSPLADAAGDAEAAVTAAATDALSEDAIRAIPNRRDVRADADERDVTRVAARAAVAAQPNAKRATRRNAAGDTEPARAAAPADALRKQRMRTVAYRGDTAAALELHVAAGAGSPTPATQS